MPSPISNKPKAGNVFVAKEFLSLPFFNSINAKETHKYEKIKKTITKYQKFIRNNFKYVGENFAHEARLIHYNEGKKKKIYGTATKKDLKELKEEGINTEIIPWINDNNN